MIKTGFLTGLAASLLLFSADARANLLVNPGFETGNASGWSTSGDAAVISCAATNVGCAPGGGSYFGTLNNTSGAGVGNGSFTQTVTLAGPGTYSFGAYVAFGTNNPAGNFDQGQISLTIQIPGGASGTVGFDPNALNGDFTIPGNQGLNFTAWFLMSDLLIYSGIGPVDALININVQDFSVGKLVLDLDNAFIGAVPVPEPASAAILLAGLIGMGVARRRSTAAVNLR